MNSLFLPLALGLPGGIEWLVIGFILLLFFGGKVLPAVMSRFGKGVQNLKDGVDAFHEGRMESK